MRNLLCATLLMVVFVFTTGCGLKGANTKPPVEVEVEQVIVIKSKFI